MGPINLKTRQQRIAYKNSEFFLTSNERYSIIGADEIIEFSSENSGIPKAQMASAFYAIIQQLRQFILNGHTLELPHLGYLYLSVSAKAVEEEKDAGAKAVKRICVKFRQNKKLRELINSNVHLVNTITAKEEGDADNQSGGQQTGGGQQTTDDGQQSGGNNTGGDNGDNSGGGGDGTPGGDE